MKRAALTLLLVAAALCAWFLWPRAAPSTPALVPLAQQDDEPADAVADASADDVDVREAENTRTELPSSPAESEPAPLRQGKVTRPKTAAESAPGTIEGHVVRGQQPVIGAQVTLHSSTGSADARPAREQRQVASTYSLSDGSFRFAGVDPGSYTLLAVEGHSEREGAASVSKRRPTPFVTLAFGKGRIRGTVYDVGGAPLPGCPLRLEYTARGTRGKTPSSLRSVARTDAEGKYAFEELAADTYQLELSRPGGKWTEGWPGRTCYVPLAEEQDLVLDAGAPRGADHWNGVLRNKDGSEIQEVRHVTLECRQPGSDVHRLTISIHGSTSNTGAFDFALEPGEWSLMVDLDPHGRAAMGLEPGTVPAGGLRKDIVVP